MAHICMSAPRDASLPFASRLSLHTLSTPPSLIPNLVIHLNLPMAGVCSISVCSCGSQGAIAHCLAFSQSNGLSSYKSFLKMGCVRAAASFQTKFRTFKKFSVLNLFSSVTSKADFARAAFFHSTEHSLGSCWYC